MTHLKTPEDAERYLKSKHVEFVETLYNIIAETQYLLDDSYMDPAKEKKICETVRTNKDKLIKIFDEK